MTFYNVPRFLINVVLIAIVVVVVVVFDDNMSSEACRAVSLSCFKLVQRCVMKMQPCIAKHEAKAQATATTNFFVEHFVCVVVAVADCMWPQNS